MTRSSDTLCCSASSVAEPWAITAPFIASLGLTFNFYPANLQPNLDGSS